MSEKQAEEFEKDPQFQTFIKMRTWDEAAKDPTWTDLKDLNYFKNRSVDDSPSTVP